MRARFDRRIALAAAAVAVASIPAPAQSVLFDFDAAPLHSPLPIVLTAGGVTAHLSATGQGFSIQDSSAPVVPIGFTGLFVYPNSVYAADLRVRFDQVLSDFSIRYSPQELGCDDSATMRVTATRNGNFVGTSTRTAANPGTWPVDVLSCSFPQGFDSVVVHYDSHPPICTDWGPIFLADDMRVTLATVAGTAFCSGDGSGTTCPCSNAGVAGNGCAHSLNANGATLSGSGVARLSADTLVLAGIGMPESSALYFQGTLQANAGLGAVFGDGLRCASGAVIRLGTRANASGASRYPGPSDLHVSVKGLVGAPGIRTYQIWYRNSAAFCTAETFNLSNGLQIAWIP